jgi:hypothetical protein
MVVGAQKRPGAVGGNEVLFLAAVLVLGTVAGLCYLRQSLLSELQDTAGAVTRLEGGTAGRFYMAGSEYEEPGFQFGPGGPSYAKTARSVYEESGFHFGPDGPSYARTARSDYEEPGFHFGPGGPSYAKSARSVYEEPGCKRRSKSAAPGR